MISETYADLIYSLKYDDLPQEVIEKAKLCFLDFLGVTLRGSKTPSAIAAGKIIKKDKESSIIGHGKSTILDASLVNGISAHSLDLDDGSRMAHIHPGATVIPAALSICEAYDKSGAELISSIVAGYQVAISLGILVNPTHRNLGFHSTGTCGTFGATAAACKALNLNRKNIINALGLAGTQASGLLESDHSGSMGKHLHAGKAAHSGIISSLLAKEGFTGPISIFEGNEGFLSSFTAVDKINLELDNFHILDVYFKKYPICRHLHSSIDATLNILKNNPLKIEDIEKIKIKTYRIAANHDNYDAIKTEEIRQSLPLSVAIAIKDKELNLDNLKINEDIKKISNKVIIVCDENLDKLYPYKRSCEVIIKSNSNLYYNNVDLPKGEPENQFSEYELLKKFYSLNPQININIKEIITNLEDYNVSALMEMLNNEFNR